MGFFHECEVDSEIRFMKMALCEAMRGFGATSPNPRVGAVVVTEGRVVSRGYHRAYGAAHAEAECLRRLTPVGAAGATLYVNLEPCCHQGKTPPCTEAIIQAGLRCVVYGVRDPNPQVNGQGLRRLAEAGIEIRGPVLEEECREINRGYLRHHQSGRPWITLKWAQSLDGRIATAGGDARWISSEQSLKLAHQLRAEHDAILIGANTAIRDNPLLTVRHTRGLSPRRVILDSHLRIDPEAALFQPGMPPVLIATKPYPPDEKAQRLREKGAELIWLPVDAQDFLDLPLMLEELGKRGILYLLVEGGSKVLASFFRQDLYDEMVVITAPVLLGGDALPSLDALGIKSVNQTKRLLLRKRKCSGPDHVLWLRPAGIDPICSPD